MILKLVDMLLALDIIMLIFKTRNNFGVNTAIYSSFDNKYQYTEIISSKFRISKNKFRYCKM